MGTRLDKLTQFAKPRLLIVDELGDLPFEPDAAPLFFQLVSRRCERGSMLITSSRAISERGTVFGDPVVATAVLDRLLSVMMEASGRTARARDRAARCRDDTEFQCAGHRLSDRATAAFRACERIPQNYGAPPGKDQG